MKEIEIPESYEARIDGNKVIILPKESEDEKIRKEIIDHFVREVGLYPGVDRKEHKWLRWLEKQKEQKPVITGDDVAWIDDLKHDLEHPEELDEKVQEVLKKRQHPAEWTDEDEKMVRFYEADYNNQIGDMSMKDVIDMRLKFKNWLVERLKSLRPQPKQEVVDRTVFDRIADILSWCNLPIGCPVEGFKQSESEREHLLEIVQCVAHRYANSCTYCKEYSRGYQDGLAVPHWKPSEEQMKILRKYVMGEWRDLTIGQDKFLTSLYNDLKKL